MKVLSERHECDKNALFSIVREGEREREKKKNLYNNIVSLYVNKVWKW